MCRKATRKSVVSRLFKVNTHYIQSNYNPLHYMGRSAHRVITQLVKWWYPFPNKSPEDVCVSRISV